MRTIHLIALAGLGASLAACADVKEAVKGPELSPMTPAALQASLTPPPTPRVAGSPTQMSAALEAQTQGPVVPGAPAMIPATQAQSTLASTPTANSLWRPGARAFFIDQRASRVGDILTVAIEIDDSAQLSNATAASRTNATTGGVAHLFGLETLLGKVMPAGYDPAHMLDQSGSTSSAGTGSVNRAEKIQLTIAAVVTGVLPNGNLVIQGRQQVKANNELRDLTVSGIVRPEDISSANTIRHTQIAEARISYGGKGDISVVQKTPAGQALMEKLSPF